MNTTEILLKYMYVDIPSSKADEPVDHIKLTTVLTNLSYYGYALNVEGYRSLANLSDDELKSWWNNLEPALKNITGDNRNIGDFVVYKNFPQEVLDKTEAEYWFPQILMYWGFPNELFTEPVKPREALAEKTKAIVLRKSKNYTLKEILSSLFKSPTRWKDEELKEVLFLSETLSLELKTIGFKENLIQLISALIDRKTPVHLTTATDVLRLGVGLSGGDVSFRTKSKFISFKRPVRKFLLSSLENCGNLKDDIARHPELWKKFLHQLHPFEYKKKFPKVCQVADQLYNDRLSSFNSTIENLLLNKDDTVLSFLSGRPGEFRRRLVHTLDLYGEKAVKAFTSDTVLDKLTNYQLVSLKSFLNTANMRKSRVFPPKGNWAKMQISSPRKVKQEYVNDITVAINKILSLRVPKVKTLDVHSSMVKLPNGNELSPYTRGTVFNIPDNVKFIRTASYWQAKNHYNIWFDNGWNFFDESWNSVGACCWNQIKFGDNAAVFSGDPTNSKDMKGRAAQLIDLYPEQLFKHNVRYAVWNILCYSKIHFSKAEDVFAALQWGEEPQKGKLFEPSRCQITIPITGDKYSSYICLLDLKTRQMIYLDAPLKANVGSALYNSTLLETSMPAFMDYINSLPSVYDLFANSIADDSNIHILYSDKNFSLKGEKAYVFKPENKTNKYRPIELNDLL
jgi:hypothetical protein